MVLIEGENGQGKSNILEAIYLLAVAKSPRSGTDRELVRWDVAEDGEVYSRVAATVERHEEQIRVQIDLKSSPVIDTNEAPFSNRRTTVQKYIRVNGVPRRASSLIGQVNAVLFTADDMDLVYGSPSVRRRYLDILISQVDTGYLRSLQRYQRIVTQRNSLLKNIREGRSRPDELEFWDDELIGEGKLITLRRAETIRTISELASPIHGNLAGNGDGFAMEYRPNVELSGELDEDAIAADMRRAIEGRRVRELAQAVTVSGPHRDELGLQIQGMDVEAYASRGQARTVVLSMRLAEAGFLKSVRNQEPVILLDDVFSELDSARRKHILDAVQQYEQCFITTANVETIESSYLTRMVRFHVQQGKIHSVPAPHSVMEAD